MSFLKKSICKTILLLVFSFFFVSCGSLKYFKAGPGNNNKKVSADVIKISRLESQLTENQKDQESLLLEIESKDATILKLQNNIQRLEKEKLYLKKRRASNPVQYKFKYNSPEGLYKKARNILLEDQFLNAAGLFRTFIKNHPKNSLADNAAYWLGECHYSLGDYPKAILVFKDLVAKYPKSEKVPDAILKLGYSYLSLDDSNRAHHFLKQVLKKYPFSAASEKAQEKLRSFE